MRCVFEDRRRANDDFPVRKRHRAALAQPDRVPLRARLTSVRFVNDQDPCGMPAKVARRPCRNDLQGTAGEPLRQKGVAILAVHAIRRQ